MYTCLWLSHFEAFSCHVENVVISTQMMHIDDFGCAVHEDLKVLTSCAHKNQLHGLRLIDAKMLFVTMALV